MTAVGMALIAVGLTPVCGGALLWSSQAGYIRRTPTIMRSMRSNFSGGYPNSTNLFEVITILWKRVTHQIPVHLRMAAAPGFNF
jgi:hypothetical protein